MVVALGSPDCLTGSPCELRKASRGDDLLTGPYRVVIPLGGNAFARLAVVVAAASQAVCHRTEIAMSDPSPSPTETTGSPRKKVSPTRNLVGLIVLVVVLAVAGFQYAALIRYTAAVKALNARAVDDHKDLMTDQEADSLLGKAPDGPGSNFTEEGQNFIKKTYTWQGPLKSFTLTAFYTNGSAAYLHHFETQGEKYVPEYSAAKRSVPVGIAKGKGMGKGMEKGWEKGRGKGRAPGRQRATPRQPRSPAT